VTITGNGGAIVSDAGVIVDKLVNLLINGSSFTGIITTANFNGIIITVIGGLNTNVVHNSNLSGEINTTIYGAIYIGTADLVERDGSVFSQIENGVYVVNSGSVLILACVFSNITVKVVGCVYCTYKINR
jgi:large exoprotein involved in heme utilization and adhesion